MNTQILDTDGAQNGGVFASKDLLGDCSDLYRRAINECLPEHKELMVQVWSPTPWMLDVNVGSADERRREIRNWCNRNLGTESSPIHGNDGNWHEGGVTIQGKTWYGFKTQTMMERFEAHFGSPKRKVSDERQLHTMREESEDWARPAV